MSRRDEEFTSYVLQRRAQLYRTAFLLCGGDAHRAEDVVQQALTKLYAAWGRAARADSVDAYARRVVVNAHHDEGRRPWRRERPSERLPEQPAHVPVSREDTDELWAALRSLPPGQRRVVVLRHYLGLSVQETAADLGVSAGTVKSQTSDGLRRLRDALSPTDPSESVVERR